ncbi:MAG: hypothetical protein M0T80_11280 [Actinomycetota bacterium]|nr:hypothetical protein [Actinomycetota bacterium]
MLRVTHSSLDLGLVSLSQLLALLACSLYGGSVIDVPTAAAMSQALYQFGSVVGPAVGRLPWPAPACTSSTADVAGYGAAVAAAWAIAPQPPDVRAFRPGLRSIVEGFA